MPPSFHLLVRTGRDGAPVVQLTGELDLQTSPELSATLSDLARAGQLHVIVEMSEVTFMDSTGLHVLLSGLIRLQEQGGKLTLVAPSPVVRRVVDASGTWRMFSICESEEEATRAFEHREHPSSPANSPASSLPVDLEGKPGPSGPPQTLP